MLIPLWKIKNIYIILSYKVDADNILLASTKILVWKNIYIEDYQRPLIVLSESYSKRGIIWRLSFWIASPSFFHFPLFFSLIPRRPSFFSLPLPLRHFLSHSLSPLSLGQSRSRSLFPKIISGRHSLSLRQYSGRHILSISLNRGLSSHFI